MKFSPEQSVMSASGASDRPRGARSGARDDDRRLHPAAGVVCPACGARIAKPCVATVRAFGVGTVGTPIEGVHAERIAAAREQGVA